MFSQAVDKSNEASAYVSPFFKEANKSLTNFNKLIHWSFWMIFQFEGYCYFCGCQALYIGLVFLTLLY